MLKQVMDCNRAKKLLYELNNEPRFESRLEFQRDPQREAEFGFESESESQKMSSKKDLTGLSLQALSDLWHESNCLRLSKSG